MQLSRLYKRRSLTIRRSAAIAVIASIAITGCNATGGSANDAPSSPVQGGAVVAALSGDPQTLDMAQNTGSLTIRVAINIFEQLFVIDKNYQPAPMLASGYEKSADGLTYTIKLRSDVKFHNGDRMTAGDVIASLKRWQLVSAVGKSVAKDVASIASTDPQAVTITLHQPRYSFIDDLAATTQPAIIVPAAVAEEAGTSPIADDKIIGTGPYKLKEYKHGQSVVLVRFDGYSSRDDTSSGLAGAKKAYIDTIEFRFVPDPAQQLNGLKSGQFQWAQSVNADEYEALKNSPNLKARVADSGLVATILINHSADSSFSDLKARQALNMAIDKKAMAQASFGPKEFWSPLSGALVFSVDKPMYSQAGKDIYETFDPKKAKKLFEAAGVTANKPIRLVTTQTYPKYYQMAVVLQSQLEKLGLKTDMQVYDFPTMISKISTDSSNWDISFSAYNGTVTSPSQVLPLAPNRPGEFHSGDLDTLKAKYQISKDPAEAKKIVDQIQQLVWEELPVISVAPNKVFDVYSTSLKDVSTFTQSIFWNCYLAA
ncbi:peptide/nickel transport system substrate-binding protein [Antricoccus suffuscus]|uniref:Peptide/nickel transport system substrate-binding protein n=1 Tax=Antricoccus suffuscus TaxID=1629062 RepID=A0A2T1A2J1_9ACTN|nr:ABC transporter substrate-binding protein [Antricoccus suffuscus]PRZ42821.1 peptide/nickel transport system substrate-binding protein [Antricoccus suffuscus]